MDSFFSSNLRKMKRGVRKLRKDSLLSNFSSHVVFGQQNILGKICSFPAVEKWECTRWQVLQTRKGLPQRTYRNISTHDWLICWILLHVNPQSNVFASTLSFDNNLSFDSTNFLLSVEKFRIANVFNAMEETFILSF